MEAALTELVSRAGDHGAAADVLEETAEYLGVGVANLINLLSPDRVVLAGWAGAIMGPVFKSQDAQEGARAFAEKRAPVWQGA